MMNAPKGLLFDKDGTLLDYHATWMPANHAAAKGLAQGDAALTRELLLLGGWDAETDRIQSGSELAAGDLDDIARLWHPVLPETVAQDIDAIVSFLDKTFLEHMEPTAVCDLPVLLNELLALELALGVATADSKNGMLLSLAPFDVLDLFVFAAGFDSGHGAKPAPGMVHGFCRETGLGVDEVWVIGDNRHDIEMAHAAGSVGIGVLTGTSDKAELQDAGASEVLSSITELPAFIRTLR